MTSTTVWNRISTKQTTHHTCNGVVSEWVNELFQYPKSIKKNECVYTETLCLLFLSTPPFISQYLSSHVMSIVRNRNIFSQYGFTNGLWQRQKANITKCNQTNEMESGKNVLLSANDPWPTNVSLQRTPMSSVRLILRFSRFDSVHYIQFIFQLGIPSNFLSLSWSTFNY